MVRAVKKPSPATRDGTTPYGRQQFEALAGRRRLPRFLPPTSAEISSDINLNRDLTVPDITALDILAFGLYVASWIGYAVFADYSRWHQRSIMNLMDVHRERWMLQMLRRENRMVDVNIIGGLQNGAAFFASTTIFALGGLIAALGASEQAIGILSSLPLVQPGTPETWRIKVLLLPD